MTFQQKCTNSRTHQGRQNTRLLSHFPQVEAVMLAFEDVTAAAGTRSQGPMVSWGLEVANTNIKAVE